MHKRIKHTFFMRSMNTRKLGNIPNVQQNEALSHTRNGKQYEPHFPTHNASKPSRLQILRNTISQRKISLTNHQKSSQ